MSGANLTTQAVLAAEVPTGQKLEIVRCPDGLLAITLDGIPALTDRWPLENVERCVLVFMSLLRNSPSVRRS